MQALESREEIAAAQAELLQRFRDRGAQPSDEQINYTTKPKEVSVLWLADLDLWVATSELPNRFRNAFGTGRPSGGSFSYIVHISSPKEGPNSHVSGLFVRDSEGRVFLAHDGRTGGGRKSIGRAELFAHLHVTPETVRCGDRDREVLLIGDVASTEILDRIAGFVDGVRQLRGSDEVEEAEGEDRWDVFVGWCCRAAEWPEFDAQEREYKVRVGENMAAAREAFLARTSDWPAKLKRGFGYPNNMTSHFAHMPLCEWAESEPEAAAIAFDHLWSEDGDPVQGIDAFRAAAPREALKHAIGTHLNLASALLMGRDATQWTIYKQTLNNAIFRASGTPSPRRGSSASEIYGAAAALFSQLAEAMRQKGASVRDALDAQSAAYTILRNEQFGTIEQAAATLKDQTTALASALRRPEVRGKWGEIALQRIVELAGLTERCDFDTQTTLHTDDRRLRPDLVVHLPNDRDIVIDAKVPLDAFLDAAPLPPSPQRTEKVDQLVRQIKTKVDDLASKTYQSQFERSPDFVVLFIPVESALYAALEADNNLLEHAMTKRIVVATPTLLIALLKTVEMGWREEKVAESAQQIRELGQSLHERLAKAFGDVEALGTSLNTTINRYNTFVGSLSSRVMPAARRFENLGARSAKELPAELPAVEITPRTVTPAEQDPAT